MKTLLLYYSYGGNTRNIAGRIVEALGCDAEEIITAVPYTGSYDSVVNQGQQEVNAGFEPLIQPLAKDVKDYDVVILGTPVWWYTFAPAMKTVLTANNWNGKTVYPFATNGGWIGHTFKDFEKACVGADVRKGLNIRFNEDHLQTQTAEIDHWISQIMGN